MTEQQIRESYQERITRLSSQENLISRNINIASILRFICFVLIIFFLFMISRLNLYVLIAAETALLVTFLYMVRRSGSLNEKRSFTRMLIRVNTDELKALDGEWTAFDPGGEHVDRAHPYSYDLDVFGQNSLFQHLNRCCGTSGRNRLAGWLKEAPELQETKARQEAVKELALKHEWRQDFRATGLLSPEQEQEAEDLRQWAGRKDELFLSWYWKYLLVLLPAATLVTLALAFFLIRFNIPVFLVLLQLAIVSVHLRRINLYHSQIGRKYKLLKNYGALLSLIENESFRSGKLQELASDLVTGGQKVSASIRKLAAISDSFDRRLNMILAGVLDGLLMWDLQCIVRLEKWKARYRDRLPVWLEVVGTFDALNSMATFSYNNPGYVYPVLSNEAFRLDAKELGHPLIPASERITNDFRLDPDNSFMLITGSNMAGKSTFLRTCGINLILAMAGAPVCAGSAEFTTLKIYTSMRVTDSLLSRESTFYAELKKLKRIITAFREKEMAFVLLDEILKGTNSRDKHFGSELFIRQLIDYNAAGMIATHDLELGRLEKESGGKIRNYCFEVQIRDSQFHYDYTLKKGVARTLNATELMRKMGISI